MANQSPKTNRRVLPLRAWQPTIARLVFSSLAGGKPRLEMIIDIVNDDGTVSNPAFDFRLVGIPRMPNLSNGEFPTAAIIHDPGNLIELTYTTPVVADDTLAVQSYDPAIRLAGGGYVAGGSIAIEP